MLTLTGKTLSKTALKKMAKDKIKALGKTRDVKDDFLYDFIKMHYDYDAKTKNMKTLGITNAEFNHLRLVIYNQDDTETEISYLCCVDGPKTDKALYLGALRTCIQDQIYDYRNKTFPSKCELCEQEADEVDHIYEFKNIVIDFEKEYIVVIPTKYTKTKKFRTSFLENEPISNLFKEFHASKATYRPLCKSCNVGRNKKLNLSS
jgi:hypothetical protein